MQRAETATTDYSPTLTGWQPDGSYVPCDECKWTPPPDDPTFPGYVIRHPGTTHRGDCPTVEFMDAPRRARLLADLIEMDRVRRRGEAEARNYVIG